MPESSTDVLLGGSAGEYSFSLEPALSTVQSLLLLCKCEQVSGFDEWVDRTYASMTPKERDHNCFVVTAFYHAIIPFKSWPDFPAYLRYLDTLDPAVLRDRLLHEYASTDWMDGVNDEIGIDHALDDEDAYLAFLRGRYGEKNIIEAVERRAFAYVTDPPGLKTLVVEHLRSMWDRYLSGEEAANAPLLAEELVRIRRIDLSGLERTAALRRITGHDLGDKWKQEALVNAKLLVFVPHAHLGSYVRLYNHGGTAWIFYGPGVPEGFDPASPLSSRREILARTGALADGTRLDIMRVLAVCGELKSQEIMEKLSLSQSAASRHLSQLASAGFLSVRSSAGAKSYRVDEDKVKGTAEALKKFLLGS